MKEMTPETKMRWAMNRCDRNLEITRALSACAPAAAVDLAFETGKMRESFEVSLVMYGLSPESDAILLEKLDQHVGLLEKSTEALVELEKAVKEMLDE